MYSEFDKICEATLWDNLKRKANITLREIDSIKNTQEKLDQFDPTKYPKKLQKLLEDIGKQFCKIFLYKCIKEFKSSEIEAKSLEEIEILLRNFQFYFFPGYTTLNGQRIFITGAKRSQDKTQRFFTGIGNKQLNILCSDSLINLSKFIKKVEHYSDFAGPSRDFWIKDIPSTVAFDTVLNQKYIDDDFPNVHFDVASTHFWKSSQKITTPDGSYSYIPMPLLYDNSEFRILNVGIGNTPPAFQNNTISISVNEKNLNESGELIAEALSSENIQIKWQNSEHKNTYIQWPKQFTDKTKRNTQKPRLDLIGEYKIQKSSYSFWLSETLNSPNDRNQNYQHIRQLFRDNGFDSISKKIIPFKKFKEFYYDKNKLSEIYYNNWYTLFLESFGESVDLGSAMFLTSHKYSSEFLMQCTNWLRWIYNELRLIEARAYVVHQTELKIFKLLKHTQRQYISAILAGTNKNNKYSNKSNYEMIRFAASIMDGHLEVIESLEDINKYISSLKFNDNEFDRINLKLLINSNVTIFKTLAQNPTVLQKCLKNITDAENFTTIVRPLLKKLTIKKDVEVGIPYSAFSIVVKECIVNMLENMDIDNPFLQIKIIKEKKETQLFFLNSVSEYHIDQYYEVYKNLMNSQSAKGRLGWWVIISLLKALGCNWSISNIDEIINTKIFKLQITIQNNE